MKKLPHLIVACILALTTTTVISAEFHIAPEGNDNNPGNQSQPFATLEKARNAARAAKNINPRESITVWIANGIYPRLETFLLTREDSGTPQAPVIFRAKGKDVRIAAGRVASPDQFKVVTDPVLLNRLDVTARGHIVQLDLKALQIQHCKQFKNLFTGGGGILQLFFANTRMPLSRWPNDGYTTMKEVLDSGMKPQPHGGTFVYRDDHPALWQNTARHGQLWISGFWRVPWVIETVRVESIDTNRKTITLAAPVSGGIGSKYSSEVNGTRKGDGKELWHALNLLEEIDQPGEWCIDFPASTLFFWPPSDLAKSTVLLADLDTPIVSIKDASNVTLMGLTLEGGLGEAVRIENGTSNSLIACVVRNTGSTAIHITGGSHCLIQSCDLYNTGAGGIILSGGDRKLLHPAGHAAINNHIHHYGQVQKIVSGLQVDGVGNRAAHNLIHDGTYGGVLYHGNDHVLELNEIHNIGLDGGDLGAFYSNADWAGRGNIIRNNFIHHAPNANGAYMDDGHSGDHILGNVMYRIRTGPFIGGGHDNLVRNNVVIECDSGIHLDDRGVSRGYTPGNAYMTRFLNTIPYSQPPWTTRYPNLSNIFLHPTLPDGNVVSDNILIQCKRGLDYRMAATNRPCIMATNNLELAALPGLLDAEQLKFNLGANSPLASRAKNYEPIPFDRIGLQIDDHRKTLPTDHETGRNSNRPPRRMFDSNVDVEKTNKKP